MYKTVKIVKGSGGWGGPLFVQPQEGKDIILNVTSGGIHPLSEVIAAATGGRVVDGNKTAVADAEVCVAVVDCGGTARCGVYPRKGILTVNTTPTGKSGPLAQFITEQNYVSAVTADCVLDADGAAPTVAVAAPAAQAAPEPKKESGFIARMGTAIGGVVAKFYQAGRDTINMLITSVLPFMAFIAMIMGIISASGLGEVIANTLSPLIGSIPGLVVLSVVCGIPFISPILGPGAVIQQIIGTLIGSQIAIGAIPVTMALPALFAISTQCGCDFIAVALSMSEAEPETVEIGVPAMLFSRLFTGPIGVIIGWIGSIGIFGL